MNDLKVFQNSEFGTLRGVEIDGESWLVGKDVAERLGYSNPQKAIRDHVDDEDKTVNESFTVNGTMAEYIESPVQADRRARAAKNSNFGRSRFSV